MDGDLAVIRLDPKLIGIPCLVTKLIEIVTHFTAKFISQAISNSDQLLGIERGI